MPEKFVHLAPPDAVKAHIKDPDPSKGRPSALAEEGLWHRVESYNDRAGTWDRDESREFTTKCGITQHERPDRMDEAETEPGGERCSTCFPAASKKATKGKEK